METTTVQPHRITRSEMSCRRERSRVPSPLRHAQFRPLALEYSSVSPPPSSCKYFPEPDGEEEVMPGGAPGGFCSAVRTVGYSTIGGKNFMSGKCPICKRIVKSADQVCTPNASPPPSPWKMNLKSPLRSPKGGQVGPKTPSARSASPVRSPLRSPFSKTNGLRSPLRSPFTGSFFGGARDDDTKLESETDSVVRGRSPRGEKCNRAKSPRSPTRSPLRSPFRGSFFGGSSKSISGPPVGSE